MMELAKYTRRVDLTEEMMEDNDGFLMTYFARTVANVLGVDMMHEQEHSDAEKRFLRALDAVTEQAAMVDAARDIAAETGDPATERFAQEVEAALHGLKAALEDAQKAGDDNGNI